MAARAQGAIGEAAQVEAVRLMAIGASGLLRVKGALRAGLFVALRALMGDLRHALRMGIVAPGTVALVFRMMGRGDLVVTALASLVSRPSDRMRFVTTAAVAVLTGRILRQDRLSLVTRAAPKRTRRREGMCLMAGRAGIVPIAKCRGCRDLRFLRGVTLHT